MAEEEKVGYGKPPKAHRFKPGQSGNPKGRPKGRKNRRTVITEQLDRMTMIRENGKPVRLTVRELLGKVLVNQAAKGDKKAIDMALRLDREAELVDAATPGGAGVLKVPGMVGDEVWEALARSQGLDKKEDGEDS
jgi:hypothetical protein